MRARWMGLATRWLAIAAGAGALLLPAPSRACNQNPTFTVNGNPSDWGNGNCDWITSDPTDSALPAGEDILFFGYSHSGGPNYANTYLILGLRGAPVTNFTYRITHPGNASSGGAKTVFTTTCTSATACTTNVAITPGTNPNCNQNLGTVGYTTAVGATNGHYIEMGGPNFPAGWYTCFDVTSYTLDVVSATGAVVDSSTINGTSPNNFNGATAARLLRFEAFAGKGGAELRWETGSEDGTLGFVVHRGTPDGPLVTRAPVPGLLNSMVGERYRALDPTGAPGTAYYLEELATDGRHLYGPALATRRQAPALVAKRVRGGATPGQPRTRHAPAPGATDLFARVDHAGLYRVVPAALAPFMSGHGGPHLALTRDGAPWSFATGPDGLLFYAPEVTATDRATDAYRLFAAHGVRPTTDRVGPGVRHGTPASGRAQVHLEQHQAVDVKAEAALRFPWGTSWAEAGGPSSPAAFPFDAPGYAGGPVHLAVHLIGVTDYGQSPEHHARVTVNGAPAGELLFGGLGEVVLEVDLPAGRLQEHGNQLGLEDVADTGVPYDVVDLASLDLSYARRYQADGDALAFDADGSAPLAVSGFSAPPALVDVTDPSRPIYLEGFAVLQDAQNYTLRFHDRRGLGLRHYLAAVPSAAALSPSQAGAVPAGSADEVAIYGPGLGAALAPLLALRQAQGLSTLAVPAEALYDAFGEGEHGTEALRRYLAQLQPAPRYVLLVGKPSLDPRDYLQTGALDLLPTPLGLSSVLHTVIAGDAALVAGPDGVTPFAEVGRLPVESAAELAAVVAKLVAAEAPGAGPSGLAVFAADDHDPATGAADPFFRAESDALAARLGLSAQPVYLPNQGHAELLAALAAGRTW